MPRSTDILDLPTQVIERLALTNWVGPDTWRDPRRIVEEGDEPPCRHFAMLQLRSMCRPLRVVASRAHGKGGVTDGLSFLRA